MLYLIPPLHLMVHYVHNSIRAKSPFLLNSSECKDLLVPRRPRSAKARQRSPASATALRAQSGQSAFARPSKARCARMRAFFIPHLCVSSSRSAFLIWPFAASKLL